jgi:hypothetical protein
MRSLQNIPGFSMSPFEMNYQYFDLIFMPIIIRYTDNEILFKQVFDEKVLNEFLETIFGYSKVL